MLDTKTIYVEKNALNNPNAKSIIKKINPVNIIEIDHYKDIFCRKNQSYCLQKENQKIILALKQDSYIYPGAPVCQSFNNINFYYSSCIMNCVCNCEYCYLKGMYPSGNLVIFVNLDDYFKEIKDGNKYICVSYDTDLFPLEKYTSYIEKWLNFIENQENIKIEIRTKIKNLDVWKYKPISNAIFAFSLSPKEIIERFEHKTSKLSARLDNIAQAQKNGFTTRLCIDPIIYTTNWKNQYSNLIDQIVDSIDMNKILDISVGSFRISQTYLKNMRKQDKCGQIVNFPFKNINGYYQYQEEIQKDMEAFVCTQLQKYVDKDRIFLWK